MEIYLIRHLKTKGNVEHRYIGTTDESLIKKETQLATIEQMQNELKKCQLPDMLISSPLKRCVETAKIYFPDIALQLQPKLKESDFGLFENKNHEELQAFPEYQAWLESNGTLPFPKGESRESFLKRCRDGFEESIFQAIKQHKKCVCFVIHGGSIMAVLSQFSEQASEFYDWLLKNGEGYQMYLDEKEWKEGQKKVLRGIKKL
ncbi:MULTISPECIES: histidine phosphatase family protein [Clostridia]|uniref:histidine phosphatase family protein n=1 Tax=Clostridia TaxID=186801 RepID=UPI00242B274D|nr:MULTISPECIES: histidine phosphatase family protein [Clostridia]